MQERALRKRYLFRFRLPTLALHQLADTSRKLCVHSAFRSTKNRNEQTQTSAQQRIQTNRTKRAVWNTFNYIDRQIKANQNKHGDWQKVALQTNETDVKMIKRYRIVHYYRREKNVYKARKN